MDFSFFKSLVNKRWRWATLAVILGVLFLVRLGFWQLDRLEWRRGLNEQTRAMLDSPPVSLNLDVPADLTEMRNRQVTAVGRYDFSQQFVILSQSFNRQSGVYLVTPLLLEDSDTAVLVNRGWIPERERENLANFNQPDGPVEVLGYVQNTQTLSGDRQTQVTAEREAYRIDIEVLEAQASYELLPVYILQAPGEGSAAAPLPVRLEPDLSLDEGNHLSYAYQWFLFAILLAGIYLYLVNKSRHPAAEAELETTSNVA